MKITNKTGLPMPFVRMAESDYKPTPKRYSATTLLKSTREILLKRRHDGDIEQDCSEMIWLLFGQAVHSILEKYGTGKSEFVEEKIETTLPNGYTVSGIIDFYDIDKQVVVDYKTASVWKVMYKDFDDWKKQGLIYAWLLKRNGLPCKKVEFYAILKDHSKTEAKFKPDYPKLPVQKVSFAVNEKELDEIEQFITAKIEELAIYEDLPDSELPLCTPEERWNSGDKFAVMKKGNKKALRVLDSKEEAEKYIAEHGGDFIDTRKGIDKKCTDYCLCCQFCDFYKSLQNPDVPF